MMQMNTNAVEKRPCPVCRAPRPEFFCTRDGVDFLRCLSCKCLYQAALPDAARLDAIYQSQYHVHRGHAGDSSLESVKQATAKSYLQLIDRHGPPGRRYLEVGCSAGAALAAAAALGWHAEGIELSGDAAEIARARPGVQAVHTGDLLSAVFAPGSIDVITFFDVIEHIDPPHETLRAVHRALAPGGLVLMLTPDACSLSARLMKARWPHLFPEHVIIYSRSALADALRRAGLEVLRIGFAMKRVNLNMLIRHATIHPHIRFGAAVRLLGKIIPRPLQDRAIPFNIGEFYLIARRP